MNLQVNHYTESEWTDLKVLPKVASNGHHSIGEGCSVNKYNEALKLQNAISYPVKPIYRNWIRNGVTV